MNEEMKTELQSFLSSISPEELNDLVNEYDGEFEKENSIFGFAVKAELGYNQESVLNESIF